MEIPATIKRRLGDEELEAAVNLGDEDIICFTPTRTLLYRGEGLISDDSVEEFDHDVDRLDMSEGRRKTSFTLMYFEDEDKFTVARQRTEAVLERLFAGVLKTAGVIESGESIEGVFRFSELTLAITEKRIVKHVGAYLWDEDYEVFPYANVTGLDFEEGSVATYIVISVDGRPQRIKAPRSDAEHVRRALLSALFAYYDVNSLAEFNETVGETSTSNEESRSLSSDINLDDSIDPLVSPEEEDSGVETLTAEGDGLSTAETEPTSAEAAGADAEVDPKSDDGDPGPDETGRPEDAIDPADIEGMKARLATLTKVAKRQNKLLKQQQETINQLVEELKRRE